MGTTMQDLHLPLLTLIFSSLCTFIPLIIVMVILAGNRRIDRHNEKVRQLTGRCPFCENNCGYEWDYSYVDPSRPPTKVRCRANHAPGVTPGPYRTPLGFFGSLMAVVGVLFALCMGWQVIAIVVTFLHGGQLSL